MKNLMIRTTLSIVLAGMSAPVFAGIHTLFAGYTNVKPRGSDALHGLRLTDLYEINNEWGVITSLAYASRSKQVNANADYLQLENRYRSIMVGPAYRLTHRFSVYGQLGMATMENSLTPNVDKFRNYHLTYDHSALALGAGVIVNPINNMAIAAGFETSRFQPPAGEDKGKVSFNTFNLNIGYRF